MSARTLTAVALLFGTALCTAACGGTVVFEEDGGQGLAGQGGSGDGGSANTSQGSTASTNPTTTNGSSTTVGPTSVSVGPGPTGVVVSASSGVVGCGTLIDDLGGLGGQDCDSCAESSCCGELSDCTQGTACWNCVFGNECSGEGETALNALGNCIQFSCEGACNGGGCNKEEFECFETGECIPFQFVCDGSFDCGDGTDESPDICGGCGPEDFQCFDGQCIPSDFVCDGEADCQGGEDEQCNDVGICGTGLFTGDGQTDQCLGATCCAEYEACTDFGADIGGCVDCLNQFGGPECNDAIECGFSVGCSSICGTGIPTVSPLLDVCLTDSCCDSWFACLEGGDQACIECVNGGGGPLCDAFVSCACGSCNLCI